MQRWIAIGVVFLVLIFGAGAVGIRVYKQNRPHPVWVPLPLNPEVPGDKKLQLAKDLKKKLQDHALLVRVSQDLGLPKKLKLATDDEAANAVAARLFVKVGEADTPTGTKVPSLNVGVTGKRKDQKISEEIALRINQDVRKILGIGEEF